MATEHRVFWVITPPDETPSAMLTMKRRYSLEEAKKAISHLKPSRLCIVRIDATYTFTGEEATDGTD